MTSFQSYQKVSLKVLRFDLNWVKTIIGAGCGVLGFSIVVLELRVVLFVLFSSVYVHELVPRGLQDLVSRGLRDQVLKILPLTNGMVGRSCRGRD